MLLMKAVFAPRPLVLASVSSPSSSRGGARRCDVIRAQSSSSSPTTPPTKKKGKKGLKKTQKQPQQQQPGGGGASSSSSSAVVQKAVAEVAKKKEEDDGPQIPFGDASGAALLLKDVFLAVADTDLLQEANAQIMSGQKIGLVGGNGCGKSTLLKCIAGVRSIQDGEIIISSKLNVGYFEQTAVSGSTKTVYEEARARMTRLNKAEAALREAERVCESENCEDYCEAADVLMDCYAEFEAAGGNDAEKRIAAVLDGLGFSRKQWDFKCDNLSGGWQMRVALARLLLSPAGSEENGLLLLDEPTNHLDEISKKWLADWIKKSPNTTVIVSHEESLLDGACSHIMEVRAKGLHWYVGNYSKFLQDRDERVRVAQASYNKLAAEAADLKDFVARFSANASKAAQASSRAKLLIKVEAEMRKLEREAAANFSEGEAGDSTKMALRLSKPPPSDQDVLMMENAVLGYKKESPILKSKDGKEFKLSREMRVVVLGPNGAGKSTLLKSLAGTMPLLEGTRTLGERVKLGVFSQDLAQELPMDKQALEYVLETARVENPLLKEIEGRQSLGALGISGPMALRKIGSLSGGEKARVALAAFVLQPRNVLLLDEPSNHLDVGAVSALTDGLQDWDGALFAVSHNKGFCESLRPTHVVRVEKGEFIIENCYGLTDEDFEHDYPEEGDASSDAMSKKEEEQQLVAVAA